MNRLPFPQAGLCLVISLLLSACAWAAGTDKGSIDAARENNTGVALMNQQLLEKALIHFEAAHKADPDAIIPLLNKGFALIYLRRLPEAEAALELVSTKDPMNARGWYGLGLAHYQVGDQEEALGYFRHAAQISPSDADSHFYVGAAELQLKDYSHAIEEFQKAIELTPLHASAQYGLARALQRAGRTSESSTHLQRFQEITQSKVGILFSTNYGEQGRYALVQDMLAPPAAVGPMIPVKFVPGTALDEANKGAQSLSGVSAGACIFDLEGNGQKAIVSMGEGENALHAYLVTATGSTEEISGAQTGLMLKGRGVSCAVGDYDNDGLPDLAVAMDDRVEVFHNLGHGKFSNVTAALGLRTLNRPTGLTFIDFDHDGDLDLYITGASLGAGSGPSVLWRNNGNSTFTEWTSPTALAGAAETAGATLSDINNDRAVDLIVAGKDPSPALFENQREGAFKRVALYDDATLGATRGVVAFDFNKDGWMDVAATHAGAPGVSLWKNVEGKAFERVSLPTEGIVGAWGLTSIDIDNDGWIDLAALVEDSHGTHLRVFRNLGARGFEDVTDLLGLSKLDLTGTRSLLAADVDGDGAADLVVARGNAAPLVLRNVGGSKNHSLRITLTGLADNKLGLGTKVEVFVKGSFQKFEVAGASGYLGQSSSEILAGLGQEEHADVVRMLWPTGVPQDELDVSAVKPLSMTELDRRGSSCPVLFAWDGKKYEFVTDVIGAGVVGHWTSPTTRNESDSDEWVKVDGSMLRSYRGRLSLRFGEPMEEINYIDQLRLVAIDHPEETEVYPDERFLNERPFADGSAVVASSERHLPRGAWGDQGQDVLPLLTHLDHEYVRDFTNLSYAGFANEHALTIDIGAWSPGRPLRLFMSGFIEYFSASSMYSAWQAGLTPQAPTVEAQLPDGSWKKIIEDMGFPAGLPRTIVVDLTGKLPPQSTRIRIRTNLQIYWDQVLVDNESAPQSTQQTELTLASAHLSFRGYPRQVDGKTPGDLTYDYQAISATGPFQWQRGNYTRYGTVTPLLQAKDDQFVIFGSGEEIDAEFSDAALPVLPAQWKRDYFFYADGFVKDMDFYEALPFTVSQMPFHGMSTYPYSMAEHYPEDEKTLKYLLDWNDRFETGDRTQLFQFHYTPTASEPIVPAP
ncbi:FG-GAP-like repeat-containing protein [Granulicella sp. S190]|uniref:FG-GAP-like repeat-containing protein n=1 Tax=Granulicella sp. S190 TaxID=1747226 RepID=UPI0020B13C02|nr:FG-GAP-like repeat-containing protein [Granulicella sp. S190]